MTEFIEIPATQQSLSRRKPLYGAGINDADYLVKPSINNKIMFCPYYTKWSAMIELCYSEKRHITHPTYIECFVISEWLLFSNFKKWMETQDWQGKELDKDIIIPGNKIYSPETCCFVSKQINVLLTNASANRGKYPQGVFYNNARNNKYVSCCRINGKQKTLGRYPTEQEASQVYKKFKSNLIISVANEQTDIRIRNGLIKHAEILLNGE